VFSSNTVTSSSNSANYSVLGAPPNNSLVYIHTRPVCFADKHVSANNIIQSTLVKCKLYVFMPVAKRSGRSKDPSFKGSTNET